MCADNYCLHTHVSSLTRRLPVATIHVLTNRYTRALLYSRLGRRCHGMPPGVESTSLGGGRHTNTREYLLWVGRVHWNCVPDGGSTTMLVVVKQGVDRRIGRRYFGTGGVQLGWAVMMSA
jgi:hypothetical protein